MRRLALLVLLTTLLCGCNGLATPPGTSVPTGPPITLPTRVAPDIHQVSVVRSGLGVFDLVVVPVAVVHNRSTTDAAVGVTAVFEPTIDGHVTQTLKSLSVSIAPGETANLEADCTDGCNGANGLKVSIRVTQWTDPSQGPLINVGPVHLNCSHCGGGGGYGTASASVLGALIPARANIVVYAACHLSNGVVVGGGNSPVVWGATGSNRTVTVNIIVRVRPTACTLTPLLYAS